MQIWRDKYWSKQRLFGRRGAHRGFTCNKERKVWSKNETFSLSVLVNCLCNCVFNIVLLLGSLNSANASVFFSALWTLKASFVRSTWYWSIVFRLCGHTKASLIWLSVNTTGLTRVQASHGMKSLRAVSWIRAFWNFPDNFNITCMKIAHACCLYAVDTSKIVVAALYRFVCLSQEHPTDLIIYKSVCLTSVFFFHLSKPVLHSVLHVRKHAHIRELARAWRDQLSSAFKTKRI